VVSGHNDALDVVAAAAGQLGALKVARLAVSGAFHTSLMEPAREALMQVLASVEIRAPRVPVLSNVTAGPFPSDPAAIRELLGRQLVEPVRCDWLGLPIAYWLLAVVLLACYHWSRGQNLCQKTASFFP
jgi:[acyl-carrier-protein] S-malonyltransferase